MGLLWSLKPPRTTLKHCALWVRAFAAAQLEGGQRATAEALLETSCFHLLLIVGIYKYCKIFNLCVFHFMFAVRKEIILLHKTINKY